MTPCTPNATGALEMSWADIDADEIFEPPVSMKDMEKSLEVQKP